MSSLFGIGGGGNVGAAGGSFYDYEIENSVRLSDVGNTTLIWTPSTASSSSTTWTMSFWIKRWNPNGTQNTSEFFSAGTSGSAYSFFSFSNGTLTHQTELPGARNKNWGNRVFRDPSGWMHFVFRANLNEATQADRLRFYVNGELQTSTSDGITQSAWSFINKNGVSQNWGGKSGVATSNPGCDHYLADINFCDGQSYAPTEFAETKNEIWVAKDTSGLTFGNNGYRLEFKQTGTGQNASGIGADTSGKDNHFAVSGLAAEDVVPDSPTNNFATMNPLQLDTVTLQDGNLLVKANGTIGTAGSTVSVSSGKWYFEARNDGAGAANFERLVGIMTSDAVVTTASYSDVNKYVWYAQSGYLRNNSNVAYGDTWTADGDIIGIALDLDNNAMWFSKNGTWQASATQSEIEAGTTTNAAFTGLTGEYNFIISSGDTAGGSTSPLMQANFGQDSTFGGNISAGGNADDSGLGDFAYTVPSGFNCLALANLPEPTISPNAEAQADDYFNTVLYTGDGTSARTISGVGYQPDFSWIKNRSNTGANVLIDSVRGGGKQLFSDKTNAEQTDANVTDGFASDGFIVGNNSTGSGSTNANTDSYVAWNWKAGGTAVSNTDGSITSSVSAAPDAGFSIVSYTGTGANATVGHGLSSAPEFTIVKGRDAGRTWATQHKDLSGGTYYIGLETTNPQYLDGTQYTGFPTNSVINVGTYNSASGEDYIAYCFHSSDICKVGSYVGNGSTDGTFVYTGFRPAFVMWKSATQAGGGWYMVDTQRNPYNEAKGADLYAQDSAAEPASGSGNMIDINSNGFKHRSSRLYINGSGATYIYLAFAEAPFKYANAR